MKKIIIILIILCVDILGAEYTLGDKKINLDSFSKENYLYVNIKNLSVFGLTSKTIGSKIILKNNKVTLTFSDKFIKVNNEVYSLSNEIIKNSNNFYVDMNFILEVLNYWLSGNKILKANDYTFPLTEGTATVSKKAIRIISTAPGITEKLYMIGASDKQIARTDFCEYPASALKLPSIGTMFSPNTEKMLSLKPDLVIAETHFNEKVLNKLKDAKVEVFAINSANNFDDMFRLIKKLGFITDKVYESRALVASLKNKINRTKYVLKNVNDKPSVYYAVGAGKGNYTAGSDTFISELIRTVGAQNVGDSITGWTFSLEKLIEANPDFIFGSKSAMNIITTNASYKSLNVVKNKSYFVVDENIFNLSGPRLINDGLKILVNKFYPSKVKELGF